MEPIEIVRGLTEFAGRGAGTDAERRAATWLARELSRDGRNAAIETFWCRPNWALTHAVHAALGVAGSLISLVSPVAGTVILGIALASVLADALIGTSPARLLTRERASQNVLLAPTVPATATDAMALMATPAAIAAPKNSDRVRLILVANYDAGRTGVVNRDWMRRPAAWLRVRLGAITPGWLGWEAIAILWLLAIAVARLEGHSGQAIRVLQFPPTVALLIGFALLSDVALASWSPAAGDNATGVAVAVALAEALESVPPQHLAVELLLTGAGDSQVIGLRRHLRSRPSECTAANTVVVGLAACAAGTPRWWISDGPLIPLRYPRSLRHLAAEVAADELHLALAPHRGRGSSPALAARLAGIPAISLGCLDRLAVAPRSHQPTDTLERLDRDALDRAVQFALLLVDAIDAAVGELSAERAVTPA